MKVREEREKEAGREEIWKREEGREGEEGDGIGEKRRVEGKKGGKGSEGWCVSRPTATRSLRFVDVMNEGDDDSDGGGGYYYYYHYYYYYYYYFYYYYYHYYYYYYCNYFLL